MAERERIRLLKEANAARPWTTDPILANSRFCNVRREDDAVTRWITANIVEPHRDDPDLWFAITVARFINKIETLAAALPCLLPFDSAALRSVLEARGDKAFGKAYRSAIPKKGQKKIPFLFEKILEPLWRDRESLRPRGTDTLAMFAHRLRRCDGIGPFLAAQVVADLKYAEPLKSAADWWLFALPGPGSIRGLNRVRGRELEATYAEQAWYNDLAKLHVEIAPHFAELGMPQLDLQNLQNCLCEVDKWWRLRDGGKITRPLSTGGRAKP